ncbi:PREDICTED: uncharacterized protein LOC102813421 [Chrysochloris asiatica]|uniref:Uncharacterized protein LOC102813421 n=1 Tax=Chrysochloris asiatica TaxID=185453 RepID=A0A9B0U849_CHRAS|nr:PREDICTED: uncharacterized protein LOC102813421 [Chrysochloris asiatica]
MYESFSCLSSGAPEPTLREGGDLDETRREPTPTFTEHVESSKDKRCKNLYPEENFPKVTSVAELYNTPKNCPPREGGNLLLSLSSIPNGSPVNLQAHNLPCVTCDDRSGLKESKHGEHMRAVALDVQGGVVGGPSSFMRKKETGGKSLLYHQLEHKTSHQVLTEELGGRKTQTNDWAFFSIPLSDEELHLGSVGQPYSGSWPEGPCTLICEQRLKKDRWRRQTCARGSGDLVTLISTSKGTLGPGNSPEPSLEEKLMIEDENLPSSVETISSCTETSIFRNNLPALGSPQGALVSTNNKKRRQIRISNLTSNFDLWGQANTVKVTGVGVPLTESHGLKIIWGAEKDRLSKINNDKEKMEHLRTFSHHPFCVYLDIIKDSPLGTGRQLSSHCLSFNRLKYSVYFSHNPIPSLGLQCRSSFWKVSFSSKKPLLTFRSHTRVDSKQDGVGLISSEVSSHQLDTLYAFKVVSERLFVRERLGEKLKSGEEPFQCLQTEDNQDLQKTPVNPLGLLQSQEFACLLYVLAFLILLAAALKCQEEAQTTDWNGMHKTDTYLNATLDALGGSLLPADLVVPLDWQTLRTLYLQWRAAVKVDVNTWLPKKASPNWLLK